MLLTNHTLTGVVLGLTIDSPAIIAPVAVASHLALDATPHYGFGRPTTLRDPAFLVLGSIDFTISVVITVASILIWPERIVQILAGVLGAGLPDFTYIPVILFGERRIHRWFHWYKPMLGFLSRIQWYERPPGAITELVWCGAMMSLITGRL